MSDANKTSEFQNAVTHSDDASETIDTWQRHLSTGTRSSTHVLSEVKNLRIPGLTVIWHTNPYRIGEFCAFTKLAPGASVEVSRKEPNFISLPSGEQRPMADPHISRGPIRFHLIDNGGIRIDRRASSTKVEANGVALETESCFCRDELAAGVVLLLAKRIVCLLHLMEPPVMAPPEDLGLIGQNSELLRVKRDILKIADLPGPLLITGESGTGKELVAHAIHRNGARSDKPFFSVNMGAIPPTLAASELFGAKKGAFSGADQSRSGFFQRAHTGTLFLDEVGETAREAQVMLLRALETGEVQQVGADRFQQVDVRVIAATDANLKAAVETDGFKAPLLHRLAGYEIALPPLRERREDIGRLLFYFLQKELEASGQAPLVDPGPYGTPWLPAKLVSQLALYPWPGNVRQLANVARQLVIDSQGHTVAQVSNKIEKLVDSAGAAEHAPALSDQSDPDHNPNPNTKASGPSLAYREPCDVDQDEMLSALRKHRWNLKRAADELRISRPSLYSLIDNCDQVRKAGELTREEIEQSYEQCGGNINAMVDELMVSKRGLMMRMKELGMR
ncbi:MAG: sigma-54 dependent transcriptional regulator [Myxococcota bacterium]|nr:sigma-54 dependent transcriptional regulator [Myxococcota bacterium]